jgi:uncharacterized protein (DUF2236 family)
MPSLNPLDVVFDRVFDLTARRRFFKGANFTEPVGDSGWFGPDSAVWYVHEHLPALMLGLEAAALIESLHPDFAWMGYDHSRAVERVEGVPTGRVSVPGALERLGHSLSFFMAVAYGPSESAERVCRAVRAMHHRVRGVRPDGRAYDADDPETLRWAHATVVWGIAAAHKRYHARPLRGERLEAYYREFVRVGEALGGVDLPASEGEVLDYLEASEGLMGVTPPAAHLLANLSPRAFPLPLRPAAALHEWAVIDLQLPYAKRLLRYCAPSRLEVAGRRAAVWAALNGIHYSTGGVREARQARRRAGACARSVGDNEFEAVA